MLNYPKRDTVRAIKEQIAAQGFIKIDDALTLQCARANLRDYESILQAPNLLAAGCVGTHPTESRNPILMRDQGGTPAKLERLCATVRHFGALSTRIAALLTDSLQTQYCLFKDKINIRPPGDEGYRFHQDFESYRHFEPRYHITAMISFVSANGANGCLEFPRSYREHIQPEDIYVLVGNHQLLTFIEEGPNRGDLVPSICHRLDWAPIPTMPCDIVFFDSFVPHGSAGNVTAHERPALFLTFVPGEGQSAYTDYYSQKFGIAGLGQMRSLT